MANLRCTLGLALSGVDQRLVQRLAVGPTMDSRLRRIWRSDPEQDLPWVVMFGPWFLDVKGDQLELCGERGMAGPALDSPYDQIVGSIKDWQCHQYRNQQASGVPTFGGKDQCQQCQRNDIGQRGEKHRALTHSKGSGSNS